MYVLRKMQSIMLSASIWKFLLSIRGHSKGEIGHNIFFKVNMIVFAQMNTIFE